MRFFLDENFPNLAAERLRDAGHQVYRAIDLHPAGTPDVELFRDAQNKSAIFLTTDRDFFHTVPFFFAERTAPVVAITLAKANSEHITKKLEELMKSIRLEDDPFAVFLVTDRRILRRE
jgi:predicted nuclease of predicted toxin-antitoxin system